MKQHLIPGSIAAAVAASVAGGVAHYTPPQITQVTHEIAVSKHAWPDMTDQQKTGLSTGLAAIKGRFKVLDIMCNDASCSDLTEDIDDACEQAGVDSVIDKSIGPLPYGVYVTATSEDMAVARDIATQITAATGIQITTQEATRGTATQGNINLLIGKHRS